MLHRIRLKTSVSTIPFLLFALGNVNLYATFCVGLHKP